MLWSGRETRYHHRKPPSLTRTVNDRKLYNVFLNHYRGALLWKLQSWHFSIEDALAYGREMQIRHYADEPVGVIRVSAELAT
jgi:hypothetical protein